MEIGRKIIHLNNVDSTSNYTANLVKEGQIDSGTVILADNQYAGRGQRGSEWLVKPGENLTFSFFLDNVNLSVDRQFVLTQIVSLSIVDLLKKFGMSAEIKWPNDIYCRGKKIAGVLIENQLMGRNVKNSIIGVGINLNQETFEGFDATSTLLETGAYKKPMDMLHSFCVSFNECWPRFINNNFAALKSDYLKDLYKFGIEARYRNAEGELTGVIVDVLDSGKLLVRHGDADRAYDLKEIQFVS